MPQQVDYQQLAGQILSQLAGGNGMSFGAGLPSSTPTTFNLYGPTGLFSTAGLENQVFSALSIPTDNFASSLPVVMTTLENPRMATITGIDSASGSEPVGRCDDGKMAGFIYGCELDYPFGRIPRMTQVYDVTRIPQQARGENHNLAFIGGVTPAPSSIMPTPPGGRNISQILNNSMQTGFFTLGIEYMRTVGRLAYNGNPANNTAGGGYMEPKGLEMLINTGHVDAGTGTACPSLDSKVIPFAADIAAVPANIVIAITDAVRYVRAKAELAGLDPVEHEILMRPEAFHEITELWPCVYATYRCGGVFSAGDERVVDGLQINRMRDEMRAGKFLLIDGVRYRVRTDYAMVQTEFSANTTYESDIFIVPRTVLGRFAATYLSVFDFTESAVFGNMAAEGDPYYTSDGGRFLWHRKPSNNWCVAMDVIFAPRIILRTPHLAARVNDVRYTPSMILPSAYPGEDGYVSGGVQIRP